MKEGALILALSSPRGHSFLIFKSRACPCFVLCFAQGGRLPGCTDGRFQSMKVETESRRDQ